MVGSLLKLTYSNNISVGVIARSESSNSSEPEAAVTIEHLSSVFDKMLSIDLAFESRREFADLKETTDEVSVRLSAAIIIIKVNINFGM
jgi:hypothetical protein